MSTLTKTFVLNLYGDFVFDLAGEVKVAYRAMAGASVGDTGKFSLTCKPKDKTRLISVAQVIGQFLPTGKTIAAKDLPDALQKVKIAGFKVGLASGKTNEFDISFATQLDINGAKIDAEIKYEYKASATDSGHNFSGILSINDDHKFEISFTKKGTSETSQSYLAANYQKKKGVALGLHSIAEKIASEDVVKILPDVNIKLDDFVALLAYKFNVPAKDNGLMLGMGAGFSAGIDLSGLPLAGPLMGSNVNLGLEHILVLYSGTAFTKQEIADIGMQDKLPEEGVNKGLNVVVRLKTGDKPREYVIGANSTSALPLPQQQPTLPTQPASSAQPLSPQQGQSGSGSPGTAVAPVAPAADTTAKWLQVEKTLGPITMQRIGIAYKNNKLVVLLDATLSMSVLKLQLIGLGFGFDLKWPPSAPSEYYLRGLGIFYKSGPIEIGGMLIRVEDKYDKDKLEFYGLIIVKLKAFSIIGIGAFSRTIKYSADDKKKIVALEGKKVKSVAENAALTELKAKGTTEYSFFIFAVYNGPIGGPAFFFVTGIALGFGYNRRVRTPKIREVRDFPLVAMALNPDPKKKPEDILTKLVDENWISASSGDYWLAAGIKFTSFKLIESFVLLIVQFGTRLQFTLVGLSVLKWPEAMPVANIELSVLVNFASDSDVITIEAMITPNSYIFDKNCKLSGGFAFFMWISGEHEGDFVITLGGYHPEFKKPAHYPDVDRLALRWKLSNIVSLSGELYFALTPKMIMAGGRWEVSCDLSFIKASVVIYANVMIAWAPVYYSLEAGVLVKIEANIKILFAHVSFKVELGARLRLWGPPFAGDIFVDWCIFKFTIPFGNHKAKKTISLTWKEFVAEFVPRKTVVKSGKKISEPNPIDIRFTAGVIKTEENKDTKEVLSTVVNPYDLVISVESFFPILRYATINGLPLDGNSQMDVAGSDKPALLGSRNETIGMLPMKHTSLQSGMSVVIKSVQNEAEPVKEKMVTVAGAKGVPGAIWGVDEKGADIIKQTHTSLHIHTTEDADPGILELNLLIHKENTDKPQVIKDIYCLNAADAESNVRIAKETIEERFAGMQTTRVLKQLEVLGFVLPAADSVKYEQSEIGLPAHMAAIGQKLPMTN